MAALKALGVEFDGRKAQAIREQHEAQGKGKEAREGSGLPEKGEEEAGQANGAAGGGSSQHGNTASSPATAVGSRVCMLFDDGVWYPGHVTRFDSRNRTRPYTIEFEDGDVRSMPIPHPHVSLTPAAKGLGAPGPPHEGPGRKENLDTRHSCQFCGRCFASVNARCGHQKVCQSQRPAGASAGSASGSKNKRKTADASGAAAGAAAKRLCRGLRAEN